jgi:hypothetical protein
MENKRIISIFLFLSVIVISLFFSMYSSCYKEGLTSLYYHGDDIDSYIIENPSKDAIMRINNIFNNNAYDNINKIKNIYDITKNIPVLLSIYESISYQCIDSVKDYIKKWPIIDANGDLVDKKTISKKFVESIQNIIFNTRNKTYSEKFFDIRNYICKNNICDDKLSRIYTNYENIWIDILKNYVNTLSTSNNSAIAAKFGSF